MQEPIFIPSLFSKVLAVILAVSFVGILVSIWIYGHITKLDLAGTLICAVIISYIVHLWIYYWKRPEGEEESEQ
jgi:hypothetical protein